MTHALTVVLKPGFAPIEQYGESSAMPQGAWTDLYALASVVYAAVAGHAPVSSVERLMDDQLQPLSALAAGRYSEPFLAAIDAALALRPADRPQTVAAFRALLDGRDAQAEPSPGFASTFAASLDSALPEATLPPASITTPDISLDSLPPVFGPTAKTAAVGRWPVYALAGTVGLLCMAAAGYYLGNERDTKPVASPAVEAAAPATAATPQPTAAAPFIAPAPLVETPAPVLQAPPESATSAGPTMTGTQSKPKREPRIAEPRVLEPRRVAAEPATRPAAPKNTAATKARCSDILQKASLEPLTASEAEYLKKECR